MDEPERQSAAEALRQQNAQLRLLSELAAGLMAAQDPIHVVQQLFYPIAGQFGIDIGFHYAVNGAEDTLHLAAYLGISAAEAQQIERLNVGQAICGTVALTRQPVHVSHIQEANDPKLQFARRHGVRACACYPLLVGDHFLGVLFFGTYQRDAFDQGELDFFGTISQHLALAKERLRAEQALRESEQRLQAELAERERAEKALAEERNRLRTILEAIPDYVYAKDLESRFIVANSAVAQAAGLPSPDEVIGKTDFELFAQPLAAEYYADEQALMSSGESLLNKDESVTERDGAKRWILSTKVPLRDSEGRIVGLAGVGRDITERKRVEEALRELNATLEEKVRARTQALEATNQELKLALMSEERAGELFSTLFHTNPVPTAITRVSDGCFIDVNEAHLRFFGLERDEMIGRTSLELNLLEPADRAGLIAELLQQGRVRGREVLIRHPSGEISNTLFFAEPLEIDGESYLIGSLVDISDRVRAEQLIRRLASELSLAEERERQRIAQMLHDEVQQMLVALKVTLFLAGEQAGAETEATLQQAGEYVQELLGTTRSLTAELSAPTLKGDKLAEALAWLRGYMGERYGLHVQLTLEAEGEIGDRDKQSMIIRLVRELLFNVFKHAGVKEAHLLVRELGEELLIRVEDEGKGFDSAPIMTSAAEGTGFGLFSVRERLALIGGRFEIESAPGAGTRATIIIPKSLLSG